MNDKLPRCKPEFMKIEQYEKWLSIIDPKTKAGKAFRKKFSGWKEEAVNHQQQKRAKRD